MTSLNPPLAQPEPSTEGEQFCFSLRRNMEGVLRTIESVPQDALAWKPPFQNSNTMGAIAVHAIASSEWWILGCVRGDEIARDRDEEFRATTTAADMRARFEAWYGAVEELIRSQPAPWFGELSHHPNGDRTNRRCLMHTVEHLAQHFGHLEITADLWHSQRNAT